MRVALITGAARGIGRAIATDLGSDHHLACTYLSTDPGPLLSERPDALMIRADLTTTEDVSEVFAQTLDRYGRLDTLVLNAGHIGMDDTGDPSRHFAVNVTANHTLLTAATPHLKPGASVVAISSCNAVLPARGATLYSASKAALNTWVRGMAKELGSAGIRVNGVAPGATEIPEAPRDPELVQQFAELTALGRIGTPQDVAAAVRFMASDAAGFITGEVLTVSGGYRL